jgi:hypothetical protein
MSFPFSEGMHTLHFNTQSPKQLLISCIQKYCIIFWKFYELLDQLGNLSILIIYNNYCLDIINVTMNFFYVFSRCKVSY